MFSSSVRRAASTAPSIPISSSFSNSAQRATACQALSYRSHQRRYSSSKPSSPADGSKGVSDGQKVAEAAAHATKSTDSTKASRQSKKKGKDAPNGKSKDESTQSLPCVPSTAHIAPNQLTASDFFSLYRPISLTNSFPKAVTDEAFAAIFTPRTKTNVKPSEVISTLSRTVENLDMITGSMRQLKVSTQQQDQYTEETDELRAAIDAESQKKEVHHLDSTPEDASMTFPRHILSGQYRPFNLPPAPAPVPENTPESLSAGAEAAAAPEPETRLYTSVLTLTESTDQNGEVVYHAHTTALTPTSSGFLSRMKARQEQYRIQRAGDMYAISVKRQRKLKMKKHKYKKLMRRTRNLRRRLDRN